MNKLHKRYYRAAKCELHQDENPVQPDLAYTPSKMFQLASQGIPVSTQTAAFSSMFDMGYRKLDFEPLPEHMRGADIADLWEKGKDAHDRISGTIRDGRKKYKAQNGGQS